MEPKPTLNEKLTPAQGRRLPKFRDEWWRWGTSTARADRSTAEAAILAMRAEIGNKTRPIFIWCDSPATSLLALHVIKSQQWRKLIDKDLGESLWSSLGSSLESSLRSSLGSSLWSSLRSSLRSSLGSIVNEIGFQWWGQHDSYWIAFYLFCRDVVGVKYDAQRSRQLDMWRDVAQSCCWWWCFENYVVCSERPTVVAMDEREVLHCETGPALAFADGWNVYAWHGTVVPAEWIEQRATLDPKIALTDSSVERRRAAASIIGWAKVLASLPHRTIDEDADPQIGTLLEIDLPDAKGSRFLKVRCATGRDFILPVPREMKTALESNSWTFDVPQVDLKQLEVRT
jgi:hypothetical protein